jgi:hypothetical protein
MEKEIIIKVPNQWSAVTLRTYLNMQKELKAYAEDEDAMTAVMFNHLCKVPVEWIQQLDIQTYTNIKGELASFLGEVELPLQRFIIIDGVEYGFEPNLSNMSYGAYVDISKYDELAIDDKWAEILSILYRPVTKKNGQYYDIKTYDGNLDADKFLDLGMHISFGALFFFKDLLKDLLNDTLKSLKDSEGIPHNIKLILERSGDLIAHSSK